MLSVIKHASQRNVTGFTVVSVRKRSKIWTAEDCIPPVFEVKQKVEDPRLPVMEKAPLQPPKDRRRKAYLTRGPCDPEEAKFIYGDCGVIALKGGWIKHSNFQLIQVRINKFLKKNKGQGFYAKWRVPAPHHPVTRHPIQAVMGGGKGKISHYLTPVRARQMIFEIGGGNDFEESRVYLKNIALSLPFPAIAVSKTILEDMYEEERRIEEENENFFTFREIVEKNMQGIGTKLSKRDYLYFGKFR